MMFQTFLAPLAYIYKGVTTVRNALFDHDLLLHERAADVATLCIGNLAVGGTGKTPHTEWVVTGLLEHGLKVATLSRGYGRRTKGYVAADEHSTAETIGDEPLQMFRHFAGRIPVSVCEDRCEGVRQLHAAHPDLDVVVLDDAFQHRYLKPTARILLTDYSRPYYADHVLPWGRLRESTKGAVRADIIIVTKCPPELGLEERAAIIERLHPASHQSVFFSAIGYAPCEVAAKGSRIVLLTGIAHPEPLRRWLEGEGCDIVRHLRYPDHHRFSERDLRDITDAAQGVDAVVTTAKDYARLSSAQLDASVMEKIVIQAIRPKILFGEDKRLFTKVLDFLRKYVTVN